MCWELYIHTVFWISVIYFRNMCLIYIHFLSLSEQEHLLQHVLKQPQGCCDWCILLSLGASTHSRHVFFFKRHNHIIQIYIIYHISLWTCFVTRTFRSQPSSSARVERFDLWLLAVKQSGCGGGGADKGGWKETHFPWVWWHASLQMTTCKKCLEDLIKYVWKWVFKGGIDKEIHHPIVKCRKM